MRLPRNRPAEDIPNVNQDVNGALIFMVSANPETPLFEHQPEKTPSVHKRSNLVREGRGSFETFVVRTHSS